jgi:hypothetical protein
VPSARCVASLHSNSQKPSLVWVSSLICDLSLMFLILPVLQLFLSSPRSTLKFAATRTLAGLAIAYPQSVAACNVDLENLISDSNRSVATYAITTLLKVWRLVKVVIY